jgi:hypothetical protein
MEPSSRLKRGKEVCTYEESPMLLGNKLYRISNSLWHWSIKSRGWSDGANYRFMNEEHTSWPRISSYGVNGFWKKEDEEEAEEERK